MLQNTYLVVSCSLLHVCSDASLSLSLCQQDWLFAWPAERLDQQCQAKSQQLSVPSKITKGNNRCQIKEERS